MGLGGLFGRLGGPWGSCGRLGRIFGCLGSVLGSSWGGLAAVSATYGGSLWGVFERRRASWRLFGGSQARFSHQTEAFHVGIGFL